MLVSGSLYADLSARTGGSGQQDARGAVAAHRQEPAFAASREKAEPEDRPAYFSMISTISPGSLAAAYQVIRAREDGGEAAPAGGRAILSGLGIPSALNAYGEVLEAD